MSEPSIRERRFAVAHGEVCSCALQYEPWFYVVDVDGVERRYTPDFRCPNTGVLFEVVGTRQAYSSNRVKIEAVIAQHNVDLRLVTPEGLAYPSKPARKRRSLTTRPDYLIRKEIQERLGLTKMPQPKKAKYAARALQRGPLSPMTKRYIGMNLVNKIRKEPTQQPSPFVND